MNKFRVILLFALFTVACDRNMGLPTSPRFDLHASAALVSDIDMKLDVTGTFWNGCGSGEYVDIMGALHMRIQFWSDLAKGVFRTTIHENSLGISGIGQVSGTRYQMMTTSHSVDIFSAGPTYDGTRHLKLRMASQGHADNPEFHAIYSTHSDPVNGFTVTLKKESIECKG